MRTVATEVSVACCVSLSETRLRRAKTAERIEVLFALKTLGAEGTFYWTGGPNPQWLGGIRCGLRQITVATCDDDRIGVLISAFHRRGWFRTALQRPKRSNKQRISCFS